MVATATAPRTEAALALHGGTPVRGPDNLADTLGFARRYGS